MNVQKVLLKGGAGIGGTALLAGAMWMYSLKPQVLAAELEPIRGGGAVGEEVRNRDFSVRVEKVEAARSLAPGLSFGNPPAVGTDGIYLIVRIRATSHREPLELRTAELETPGGFTFREDPRTGSASGGARPTFQPMIWTRTAFVFELPKKRLEGAHLVVGTGGLLPQLSAAADIDLGLTGERADELIRNAPDRYDARAGTP
ncbi:hypothetical protein E1264_37310 [Actinomadura sp. KC216]|uniref:hypothetical protein n=1 Tax=Actinomadura sp. KC216 TaxID=2530370 RepID=UPI00104904A8|nr:hypothetical protein [Actinomadura sp. KC216]TDB77756.1 hypothetical protein E1264_37310 [Actinomadura sp. KC216]